MEKSVYVVGGNEYYYRPFAKFGEYLSGKQALTGSLQDVQDSISLVLFTGGEDIDPSLYAERRGNMTAFSVRRDAEEVHQFMVARRYGLPMVGVCRGSQFLCAMSGGRLVQHCDNHGGRHLCELWDGRIIEVSSTHHQMQVPPDNARILGWASPSRSNTHLDGEMQQIVMDLEVEIAYYPSTRALGIQHHPEMQMESSDGFRIAAELVETFLMT